MEAVKFVPFSTSHWAAMLVTLGLVFLFPYYLRGRASAAAKSGWQRALAVVLVLSTVLDLLAVIYRLGFTAASWEMMRLHKLPFHLCDLAALVLAVTLWRGKSSRTAEVGYIWGMAGTVQGLITPTLSIDFPDAEYLAFFFQHSGVPIAAAACVFGLRLYPSWKSLLRVVYWSWGFLSVVYGLNLLLNTNYGFLMAKPETASLFDVMGPWPWYLLSLQGVGIILYSFWLAVARGIKRLLQD